MPYAQNLLPRDPFPRGLGELAQRAGGYGTWVVDMTWGLSPPFITGQNRPYGTPVVQTFYPRSQAPRLQNLQTGPVVAAGTWPDLLQADSSPVFRTPVRRVGEQQISLPPGAGVAGLAGGYSGMHGYGHIPLGVARPPTNLYERSVFGSRGTAGFGEEPEAGVLPDNLTILGMNRTITPAEWQDLLAHQAELKQVLYALYTIYAARLSQMEYYNFVNGGLQARYPDAYERQTLAVKTAFGSPDAMRRAVTEYQGLMHVRQDLQDRTTPEQVAAMPADIRRMFEQFVYASAPGPLPSGLGIVILGLAIPSFVVWAAGGIAALLGVSWAVIKLSDLWSSSGLEGKRLDAIRANAEASKSASALLAAEAGVLNDCLRNAKTQADRDACLQALASLNAAWGNVQKKLGDVNSAAGLPWSVIVFGAAVVAGLFVALKYLGRGKPRDAVDYGYGGRTSGGGGGGGRREQRSSEPSPMQLGMIRALE